jgi:hypothetical protein
MGSAGASSTCGEVAGGSAPLVTKFINSLALPITASGLHPISMAIRKHAIR